MKKLLILLTLLTSVQALGCSCWRGFSERDTVNMIEQFLENKHGINREDIIDIETLSTAGFLSSRDKVLLKMGRFITEDELHTSLEECAFRSNEKANHIVTYTFENKICEMKLKTKMKSNLLSEGFKSTVTQKFKPVCD